MGDVENGLVTFLKAQRRATFLAESVAEEEKAVTIIRAKAKQVIDFTRVIQVEQDRVQQQDTLAQAQGEIALGLIQVYRALGGGWQIRCTGCATCDGGPQLFDGPESNSAAGRRFLGSRVRRNSIDHNFSVKLLAGRREGTSPKCGITRPVFRPLPACPAGEAVRRLEKSPPSAFDPCRLVRQVKQFAG